MPLADVGNPRSGTTLYSVTAFTATSATPQSATTLFNLTDATTPFDHVIGSAATSVPETPLTVGLVGAGIAVLGVALVRTPAGQPPGAHRLRCRGRATCPVPPAPGPWLALGGGGC